MRPNPDSSTETPPTTPASAPDEPAKSNRRIEQDPNQALLAACGIPDFDGYAAEVQRLRSELDGLERLLEECDDRALLQQAARQQLAGDGEPITRLAVARRAARLLEAQTRQRPIPAPAARGTARDVPGETATRSA
ncbi:MAG TPA: hypothetical protein VLR26_13490 [Frankiaceae bacterium]|nr:hypothetical protein [Frankiaceae bacterium]